MMTRFRSAAQPSTQQATTRDLFATLHEISFAPTLPALSDVLEWSERKVQMQIHMDNHKPPVSLLRSSPQG